MGISLRMKIVYVMHTSRKLELGGLLCHLWYPVPGLPDHDGRGEGHATLPGRPEGRSHQLVNSIFLNNIKMIATSCIYCLASPTTTAVVRAMQRCPAAPKAAPTSWLIVYS